MPVSAPLLTPSVQLGTWQQRSAPGAQPPGAQTPLWQSTAAAQALPLPQSGQRPPQSTSLSLALRTPSLQLAAWQHESRPAPQPPVPQTPLWQSPGSLQPRAVGQLAQLPPQSTSLSSPFFTPSVQLAALQLPFTLHTRLSQSLAALQAVPSGQPGQLPP